MCGWTPAGWSRPCSRYGTPSSRCRLSLEAPGVDEARAERRKLLSQIDDYLLPRLRQSGRRSWWRWSARPARASRRS